MNVKRGWKREGEEGKAGPREREREGVFGTSGE